MNAHALLGLLKFLARRDYVLVLNPKDYTGKIYLLRCPQGFDVNTHAETIRIGLVGSIYLDVGRQSSIYINSAVPSNVVVRIPAERIRFRATDGRMHCSELDIIHDTWPDVPDDMLPWVHPKPRHPLSTRCKRLLAECVDQPKRFDPKAVALKTLIARELVTQTGPCTYLTTPKGRLITGRYRTAWARIDDDSSP